MGINSISNATLDEMSKSCIDYHGSPVQSGKSFCPEKYQFCICKNGLHEDCKPCVPQCRKLPHIQHVTECCQFVCQLRPIHGFHDSLPDYGGNIHHNGQQGLRLIGSTITSFLILALLFLMIHRLRQRRLVLMIRRLQNRRLEAHAIQNSFPSFDQSDFTTRSPYYLPPPPYAAWKASDVTAATPSDAPPSYEESVNRYQNSTSQAFPIVNEETNHQYSQTNVGETPSSNINNNNGSCIVPVAEGSRPENSNSIQLPKTSESNENRCSPHNVVITVDSFNGSRSESPSGKNEASK